jgi:hypothetical protein
MNWNRKIVQIKNKKYNKNKIYNKWNIIIYHGSTVTYKSHSKYNINIQY